MKVLFFVASILIALAVADEGHGNDVEFVGFSGFHYASQPTSRFDHHQAAHDGKIYIHGGVTGAFDTYLGDTLVLTTGTGVGSGFAGITPAPGGPNRAKAASAYNDAKWYIVGGVSNNDGGAVEYWQDTWAFDFATNSWSELTVTGSLPTHKIGANAWIHDGHLYVAFGRDNNGNYLNEIHALNLETLVWEDKTAATEDKPTARFFASGVYVAGEEADEGHYYLFGGYQAVNNNLNDFHVLDVKELNWDSLSNKDEDESEVTNRSGGVMWSTEDGHLFLNGGETSITGVGESYLGDTWEYSIEDDEWTLHWTQGSYYAGRFGHRVTVLNQNDEDVAYIYGGARVSIDGSDTLYLADFVWHSIHAGFHCDHSAASSTQSFLAELF